MTSVLPEGKGLAMKTAEAMLKELLLHVRPPRGCAIVLTERESSGPKNLNWVASAGITAPHLADLFAEKVAELRKTDPKIDWSDSPRRLARWLSEVEDH
jgi:hypothetical protein